MTMTMASVFSGIGGEMVAATMMGWDVEFFCEKNPFGHKVLSYWYPNAEKYEDVTTTDFEKWRGRIDVLTGGFPCQPFSYAGKRKGADDDRYLWPFMYRAIDQIQPTWIVAENVGGILTMVEQSTISRMEDQGDILAEDNGVRRYQQRGTFTLQRICRDLQKHGYSVQPVLIPACAVEAPHRRDRVFIVAHRDIPKDSVCGGQFHGQHEEQGSERHFGDACPGSSERICGEAQGVDTTHSASAGLQHGYQPGSETSQTGAVQGEGHSSERNLHAAPNGNRGVATDARGDSPSDALGCGEGTPRQGSSTQSNRCDENQQSSQRGTETERLDGCPELLRNASNTRDNGCEGSDFGGSETEENRRWEDWFLFGTTPTNGSGRTPTNGSGRTPTNTPDSGVESMRREREDAIFGRRTPTDAESEGRGELREPSSEEGSQCGDDLLGIGCGVSDENERLRTRYVGPDDEGVAGLGRWDSFPTVSPVHRGNDGFPFDVDRLTISFPKWRTESLKAYGNAIVPQVMYEIFRAIEAIEKR